MAGAQVAAGYSPPIGGFWGNLPVLSQINEASDLAHNPDANVAHDVSGIASLLAPGPAGLALGAISSALPGGWLDSVLGLGDFSSTLTAPAATGEGNMSGLNYTPGLQGNAPGTGFWGGVQDIGNTIGSGIGDIGSSIGSGISSLAAALGLGSNSGTDTSNQGMGSKFGG